MAITVEEILDLIDQRISSIQDRIEEEGIEPSEYDMLMANLQEVEELKRTILEKDSSKIHVYNLDDDF